jgi:hypothetical protein
METNDETTAPEETNSPTVGLVDEAVEVEEGELGDESDASGQSEQIAYYPQTHSERIEWERLRMEQRRLRMEISDNSSERTMREAHATKAFWLTAAWGAFLAAIIVLKGVNVIKLKQVEFLTVIGALTTSVFGFYLLVMKFLFERIKPLTKKKTYEPPET